MINSEPKIKVAFLQNYNEAQISLNGRFSFADGRAIEGQFTVRADQGLVVLIDSSGRESVRQKEILLSAADETCFTVSDVKIGIDFHWQRSQEQSFRGNLFLSAVPIPLLISSMKFLWKIIWKVSFLRKCPPKRRWNF